MEDLEISETIGQVDFVIDTEGERTVKTPDGPIQIEFKRYKIRIVTKSSEVDVRLDSYDPDAEADADFERPDGSWVCYTVKAQVSQGTATFQVYGENNG